MRGSGPPPASFSARSRSSTSRHGTRSSRRCPGPAPRAETARQPTHRMRVTGRLRGCRRCSCLRAMRRLRSCTGRLPRPAASCRRCSCFRADRWRPTACRQLPTLLMPPRLPASTADGLPPVVRHACLPSPTRPECLPHDTAGVNSSYDSGRRASTRVRFAPARWLGLSVNSARRRSWDDRHGAGPCAG